MIKGAATAMLFCAVAAVLAVSLSAVLMASTTVSSIVSIVLAIYSVAGGDYLNALAYSGAAVAGIIGVCKWYKMNYRIECTGKKEIASFEGCGEKTPRVFTSTDPLVGDVATQIEEYFPGRVKSVNELVYKLDGTILTDLDIELDTIVIQVKTGGGNRQTKQLIASVTGTGKIAIGYVPDVKPSVYLRSNT